MEQIIEHPSAMHSKRLTVYNKNQTNDKRFSAAGRKTQ